MTVPLTTAEVIAVGSELLGTTRVDTNSLFISDQLRRLGIELTAKSVVGDDRARLGEVFGGALRRADLVILTGGLGPTDDDLTRESIADALGLELIEDPAITARIRQRFEARGMPMPEVNRRQAMVHRGATSLPNSQGSAPGILIATGGKLVVLLPGPPRELQPMLAALCAEGGAIAERAGPERLFTVSLFTAGLAESRVEELVQPIYSRWREAPEPITTTILAAPGQVELHLTMRSRDVGHAKDVLERSRAQLAAALGESVFSTDGRLLPEVVGDLLREKGLTFAAAESCTGGLVLQRMTDVPGSSAYVKGGVVAYSNELKIQLLGVDAALLDEHGAVSEPVAAAMADGVRERTGADVCVSITGIAGPGGGSEMKPVGTVVIAVLVKGGSLSVQTHRFPGGREMVRLQSSQVALDRVRRMLATEETQKKH
jgi:nicotinamide-nucleotide amidase